MGEVYTYNGTHLTLVDAEEQIEFTQRAEHGEPGGGTFVLDDTAGTLALVGQKDFSVTQSSCSFPLLFRGFIGSRVIGRNEVAPQVSAARKITVSVEDLNSMLGHRLIHQQTGMTKAEGGKRPAETVAARGAWLMASPFVDFADNGRCDFPATKGMDAADYRNRQAGDVLADMALAAGAYNYHVNDWGSGPELTFRNDNTSTADSSTLRISNVLSDASSVTLNPTSDAVLTRSPANVISKIAFGWSRSTEVEERAATATAFNGERSGTASNSNVKTAAKAIDEAQAQLWQLHTEEDIIECGLDAVTSAQVNLILAGMRIQAKFSHLNTEGYGSFTWFRVLERTVRPIVADAGLYSMDLKLSPQEEAQPAGTILQYAVARGTHFGLEVTLPNPVTIGSTLVCLISTKLDPEPGAPNIDGGLPRWGAGAWTRFNGSTKTSAKPTASGIAAWYKTADSTDQIGYISEQNPAVAIYELAGVDPTAATIADQDETVAGPNYDIGTQTPASGDVAIAGWNLGSLNAPASFEWAGAPANGPFMPYQTTNPDPAISAGWTLDYSKWVDDSSFLGYTQPSSPWTVFAHALGSGSSLLARVTPGESNHPFGALYIVIPAA
jgi:hypothetical protein